MADVSPLDDERDTISSLLRSAGHRPVPPRETAEAVYFGALVAWRRVVRRRRWRFALAAAAALACFGIGVAWWATMMREAGAPAATIASATGCGRIEEGLVL